MSGSHFPSHHWTWTTGVHVLLEFPHCPSISASNWRDSWWPFFYANTLWYMYNTWHPISIMTLFSITGTHDYYHPVDPTLWTYTFITESKRPSKVYSQEFYQLCSNLCKEELGIDLHKDITSLNCFEIYVFWLTMFFKLVFNFLYLKVNDKHDTVHKSRWMFKARSTYNNLKLNNKHDIVSKCL